MPSLCPGPYVAWPPTPRLYPQTPIYTDLESLGRASPVQAVSMTTDPLLWEGKAGTSGSKEARQHVDTPGRLGPELPASE